MLPSPGKLLRLVDLLVPTQPVKAVKDLVRTALDGVVPPAAAPQEWRLPCLAPLGPAPDLSAVRQGRRWGEAAKAGQPATPHADEAQDEGTFTDHTMATPFGTYDYKLFQPAGPGRPTAVLLMLHGCTQRTGDFAAGTRMNAEAARHHVAVIYPQQSMSANLQRCWNWFEPRHQKRDHGEPAALAALTEKVMRDLDVPTGRAFVAGLSAGGAMAAVLGQAYPDLFAAVGIHSGLPAGAAHDVGSAFAAMRDARRGDRDADPSGRGLPTIIFHGDADSTVDVGNAAAIVDRLAAQAQGLTSEITQGRSAGGRDFQKQTGVGPDGRPRFERWTIKGFGHAWSGGSVEGSYADPSGPPASAEMLRFFLAQLPGAAIRPAA